MHYFQQIIAFHCFKCEDDIIDAITIGTRMSMLRVLLYRKDNVRMEVAFHEHGMTPSVQVEVKDISEPEKGYVSFYKLSTGEIIEGTTVGRPNEYMSPTLEEKEHIEAFWKLKGDEHIKAFWELDEKVGEWRKPEVERMWAERVEQDSRSISKDSVGFIRKVTRLWAERDEKDSRSISNVGVGFIRKVTILWAAREEKDSRSISKDGEIWDC